MAGAVACVLILVLVVTLGGGRGVRAHTRAHASSGAEVPRVARTRVASHHAAAPATAPGSLPQTHAEPSTAGRAFAARMSALWSRVRNDSTAHAMSAFFPEQAYVQVKAEGAPEADWQERLVGDFRLDLHAAHALLGADSAGATLIAVRADGAYAHWVAPGACFNRVGYWELPNARLVYRQGRTVRSFGIASLISWRGEWYVVHLGAVEREGAAGIVDAPSSGAGASVDSGTC